VKPAFTVPTSIAENTVQQINQIEEQKLPNKNPKKIKGAYCFFSKSDFLFAEGRSEGFATALAQADCKFRSLSCFVRSASHLPRFFRSDFFTTRGTFCHKFASLKSDYRIVVRNNG
jgi:hypothetical protein